MGQHLAQLHDRYMMMMMMIKQIVLIAVCLMKFRCKIIEDDDNAETCRSIYRMYIYIMYSCAFVGVTEALR